MKLTMIRHGITEGNLRRLYYGSTDLELLPQGLEELEKLRLAGGYPSAAHYYTSGMRRTEQTFAALFGDMPHGILPEFREMDFGDFEMRSYEQMKDDPAYQAWITGDVEANVCPGGESGNQVTERSLAGVRKLLEQGEDAVVVTHGGVIGGLMQAWFPVEYGRYTYTPKPGTGFTVEFENGKPLRYENIPAGKDNRQF